MPPWASGWNWPALCRCAWGESRTEAEGAGRSGSAAVGKNAVARAIASAAGRTYHEPVSQSSVVSTAESHPLIYRIDAANRIVWVNDAWSEFARANHGESVMPAQILGHDLLASFADGTVRELYATMIRHVRSGKTVSFDYRCDAPDRRRTFNMEIRPGSDGEVEFVSTLLHETPRAPVILLKPGVPRDKERFIRLCSWCQSVAMPDGRWLPVEEAVGALHLLEAAVLPRITHGMCEACHERMEAALGA
jgi:hypothetical protein